MSFVEQLEYLEYLQDTDPDEYNLDKAGHDKMFEELLKKINDEEKYIFSDMKILIDNNSYCIDCKSNNKKDFNSLSYLLDIKTSQSDNIKLGNALERVLLDIVIKYNKNLENKKPKNTKGIKEMDHFFIDQKTLTIYYAELKSNLNLDTEKSKQTIDKITNIHISLVKKYPLYKIKSYLIGGRYVDKENIPNNIIKKYKTIDTEIEYPKLVCINEYFNELQIELKFNEDLYKYLINYIAKKCFQT